ncbi:cold shock domain-containing protein [Vannielia litorea]|uniref:NB-ARC domain-containing protein n=1 Tax=Vannielia litorea TaxID=1217970 RepID=UPI001C95C08D|nr:NB-ARC domain-containing protein [Vannielia litorea]MBY6152337.1 cold shock domain-containing protein [Vannielia litorea]
MASVQRIALFVLFDALEFDLVERLRQTMPIGEKFLSEAERTKGLERMRKSAALDADSSDIDLVQGLDLAEKFNLLLRAKDFLPATDGLYYKSKKSDFDGIVSVRNSVMHGRPMTIMEYSKAFTFAEDLIKSKIYWPNLYDRFRAYNADPNEVARTSVIEFLDNDPSEIYHNLPLPDYDDTGFIPRPTIESDLKSRILGRHPVVTVLGDGGNGKTAVTLQTLYSLIASNDHSFDAIVWVSAKSSTLARQEIERIEGAINSSLGVFHHVVGQFEGESDDPLGRVRQLLSDNKILLVIDNLETILDSGIQDFAKDVPGESKLLLTSRIPLGGDLTVQVPSFAENEAIRYLRTLIKTYDINSLRKSSNERLKATCQRLGSKPLLLKWFALGVLSGLEADRILANPEVALRFCLENVLVALSEFGSAVILGLSAIPKPCSISVLEFVLDISAADVENGIAELLRFGLIEREDESSVESNYRVKTFVRSYIVRVTKPKSFNASDILARFRSIDALFESESASHYRDRYNIRAFTVRSKSEAVAVRKLRSAVGMCHKGDYDGASQLLSSLKISNPDYFEVYRVDAFIAQRQGDLARAKSCYEVACELGHDQPQIFSFFAGFLLRAYGDNELSIEQFDKALILDPGAPRLLSECARANMFAHNFSQAQTLIDQARIGGYSDEHTRLIFTDLQIQVFYRNLTRLLDMSMAKDASDLVEDIFVFLAQLERRMIDFKMVDGLRKLKGAIERVEVTVPGASSERIENSIEIITELFPAAPVEAATAQGSTDVLRRERLGKIKVQGLKPSYGFLVCDDGEEFFLHKDDVSPYEWDLIKAGTFVQFDTEVKGENRPRACNVMVCT